MLLAKRKFTVGDKRLYTINYEDFLEEGEKLTTSSASSSSDTAVVTYHGLNSSKTKILFYVDGGTLNETFTVTINGVTDKGQTVIDTIEFTTVSP